MALHPCPRCGQLVPVGVPYCADCRPIAEAQAAEAAERKRAYMQAQYSKVYNRRRDPKYLAFYRSKEWKTLSRAYLQDREYRCEARLPGCTRLAVETHHRAPIQTEAGWDKRLSWDNLEAVCTACHNGRHPQRGKRKETCGVVDLRTLPERDKDRPPGGG